MPTTDSAATPPLPDPTSPAATTQISDTAPGSTARANGWSYGAVWRRVPRALGYLIPTFLIAIVVSVVLTSLVSTAGSLLIVVVGVFLLSLSLLLARYFGNFEVIRLRASGERPIIEPEWRTVDTTVVSWKRALAPLGYGRYWLSMVHGAIVAPIIATVSFVVLTVWFSFILAAIAVPIVAAVRGTNGWFDASDSSRYSDYFVGIEWIAPVIVVALGVAAVLTLPYALRSMTWLHAIVARPFLGRFSNTQLEAELVDLFPARQVAGGVEPAAAAPGTPAPAAN